MESVKDNMKKPLIGITTSLNRKENLFVLNKKYAEAVVRAGGLPVPLGAQNITGNVEEWIERLDGILFSGGTDILPKYFGEECLDGFPMEYEIVPERDMFEIELFREAWKKKMPILGICRGFQLIAVAAGGKVLQDIETGMKRAIKIRHSQKAPDWCEEAGHKIWIERETKLWKCYQKEEIWVNSFHHQAVSIIPEEFLQVAIAADGVIEAIEAKEYPFCIGVQWHPERTDERVRGDANLFHIFVKESINYRNED